MLKNLDWSKKSFINYLILKRPSIYFMPNPFKIYEFKELLKNVKISNKNIILDVGCGNGFQKIILIKRFKWIP